MPKKQEGSKVDLVRDFLKKNPGGTFKDFDKEFPEVLTSSYFATMKSQLKKKGELEGNPSKKTKASENGQRRVTKRPTVQSSLQDKIDDQKHFLAWVELGMEHGYVDKLKDHLE
jgi:hypothetical protein